LRLSNMFIGWHQNSRELTPAGKIPQGKFFRRREFLPDSRENSPTKCFISNSSGMAWGVLLTLADEVARIGALSKGSNGQRSIESASLHFERHCGRERGRQAEAGARTRIPSGVCEGSAARRFSRDGVRARTRNPERFVRGICFVTLRRSEFHPFELAARS
jgi:hypothetical protein